MIRFSTRVAVAVFVGVMAFAPGVLAQVNHPPVADAGADVSVFFGESAILTASATDADGDPIESWNWAIDSQPAGSSARFSPSGVPQTVIFAASTLGAYSLSVVVCDFLFCSLPASVTVNIVLNQPPVAVAAADVVSGFAPLTVNFDGSGGFDPERGALFAGWLFGDGSAPSIGINASHTYTNPGVFVADVTVTDPQGLNARDTVLITVMASANTAPVASPTATPNQGPAPLATTFNANATDADADTLTYIWDFGDPTSPSNTSALENPGHTYAGAGTYVAWLTVSDGINDVSESVIIVVDSVTIPSFDFTVSRAKVRLKKQGTQSKVRIKGTFTPTTPGPDDVIVMRLGDTELFAAPFSNFVLAGLDNDDDDEDEDGLPDDLNPNKYKFKTKHINVEIDIKKGRISVHRKKLNLAGFDPTGGTVIEFFIGDKISVDTITLSGDDKKLEYKQ